MRDLILIHVAFLLLHSRLPASASNGHKASVAPVVATDQAAEADKWKTADANGRIYWWHTITRATQWEMPDVVKLSLSQMSLSQNGSSATLQGEQGGAKEFIIQTARDRRKTPEPITVRASELQKNLSGLRTFFSNKSIILGEKWYDLVRADKEFRSSVDYFMQCFDDFDQLHDGLSQYWQTRCNHWKAFANEVISEFLPSAEEQLRCQSRGGVLFCPVSGFYVRYKDASPSNDGALGALLHTDGGDGYYDDKVWNNIKAWYFDPGVPGGEWANAWVQLYGDAGRQILFVDPSSIEQRKLPYGPRLTPYPGREGLVDDWKFVFKSDLRAGVGFVWNTTSVPHVNALPANVEAQANVQPTLTVDVRCTCLHPEVWEWLGNGPRLSPNLEM